MSILFAWKYFAARPLFGLGLSVVDIHSTLFSLLADVGVIGTLLWTAVNAVFARTTKKSVFFVALVYLSMTALGGVGFAFSPVIPVVCLFAEQFLGKEPQAEKERKKVLFITGAFPKMPCGVGDYTAKLCRCIAEKNAKNEIVVVTSFKAEPLVCGAENVRVRNEIEAFYGVKYLRKMKKILKEEQPDIVHFEFPSTEYKGRSLCNFLWLPLVLKTRGVTTVFTVHEYEDKKIPLITAPFLLCADKIICVEEKFTEKIVKNYRFFFDKDKVSTVRIGSNIPCSKGNEEEAQRIRSLILGEEIGEKSGEKSGEKRKKIAANFGFISEGKKFDVLIEALGKLKREGNLSCKLLIIGRIDKERCGEGYYKKLTALIEEYGLKEDIYESGYLEEDEVGNYLKAADFCVLPFGKGASCRNGSLLAAAQEGKKIISSLGGQEDEALKTEQFALVENTAQAWAEAILKEQNEQNEIAYKAFVPAWEDVAARHEEVYRGALYNPLFDGAQTALAAHQGEQ